MRFGQPPARPRPPTQRVNAPSFPPRPADVRTVSTAVQVVDAVGKIQVGHNSSNASSSGIQCVGAAPLVRVLSIQYDKALIGPGDAPQRGEQGAIVTHTGSARVPFSSVRL